MTAKEIIIDWLKAHGYDGLCSDECGCRLDDLMPGECSCPDCVPGYLREINLHDWIIVESQGKSA
jgi:hypothetical protein